MKGYFGIGIYRPKTIENLGTLWRSAKLFGASYIFTIGNRYKKQATDTMKSENTIPLFHFETYEDFLSASPKNAKVVCVELADEARELGKFCHPKQAVYLLGAEDAGIPPEILEKNEVVKLESTGVCSLNVATTGSIVMYHRFIS